MKRRKAKLRRIQMMLSIAFLWTGHGPDASNFAMPRFAIVLTARIY